MATYTSNINLKKPAQSDKIRIADFNTNADNIDDAFGAGFGQSSAPSVNAEINSLADGLAIIANGNVHAAISSGWFVYVRGHETLANGLYVANQNISANATLTSSNLDADSSGGLNALSAKITDIGSYTATTEATENVANETVKKLATLTLSAGRYLFIGNVSFASNATGSRTVSLGTGDNLDSGWWQSVQASPYGSSSLQVVRFATVNGTNPINLVVRQTSGSTLSVTHRMFAIKLHE